MPNNSAIVLSLLFLSLSACAWFDRQDRIGRCITACRQANCDGVDLSHNIINSDASEVSAACRACDACERIP